MRDIAENIDPDVAIRLGCISQNNLSVTEVPNRSRAVFIL
jgi:hypothetical protein